MDAKFRVDSIYRDPETSDIWANCYDLVYGDTFDKYIGQQDDPMSRVEAAAIIQDSNYEMTDDIRNELHRMFNLDDVDPEMDDEFDWEDPTEPVEDDEPMESLNIRESLNRIDINTDNKYDLLNLYESCTMTNEDKKELATLIYDKEDPSVIYDTLNGKFLEGKYGGAFDMEDDLLFTRDDLNEFGEDVADAVSANSQSRANYVSSYIDNGELEITLEMQDYEETVTLKIDMRKFRNHFNLYRAYGSQVVNMFIDKFTNDGITFDIPLSGQDYPYDESLSTDDVWKTFDGTKNSLDSILDTLGIYRNDLTEVTIPDGVTKIGDEVFYHCTSLKNATIPNSVTSIGDYAFCDCFSLTSITIPGSVTSIGVGAFDTCTNLANITILNGVTSIGEKAFAHCGSLTSVAIPDSVTSIDASAFYECYSLKNITIPNSVNSIGSSAFGECSSLTSVTIPDSVTRIGSWAFADCESITSIAIPNSVTKIGYGAFNNCDNLTVHCNPGSYAEKYANSYDDITVEYLNESLKEDYSEYIYLFPELTDEDIDFLKAYNLQYLGKNHGAYDDEENWVVQGDKDNLERYAQNYLGYELHPDYLYDADEFAGDIVNESLNEDVNDFEISDRNYLIKYNGNDSSVTIPDGVKTIGGEAFKGCKELTNISIPNSVTFISDYAFAGCTKLSSIILPNSVTTIGNNVFYDCRGLTSITIPDSVAFIGTGAFQGCTRLTDVVIPDRVRLINGVTFRGCKNLKSVTISNFLTDFGYAVFEGCDKLTIKCKKDSYAEKYAKAEHIPVEYLNESLKEDYNNITKELSSIYNNALETLLSGANLDVKDNISKAFSDIGGTVSVRARTNSYIEYSGKLGDYRISGSVSMNNLKGDLNRLAEDLTMAYYRVKLGGELYTTYTLLDKVRNNEDVELHESLKEDTNSKTPFVQEMTNLKTGEKKVLNRTLEEYSNFRHELKLNQIDGVSNLVFGENNKLDIDFDRGRYHYHFYMVGDNSGSTPMSKDTFLIDPEYPEETIEEMASSVTREAAYKILSPTDFAHYVELQDKLIYNYNESLKEDTLNNVTKKDIKKQYKNLMNKYGNDVDKYNRNKEFIDDFVSKHSDTLKDNEKDLLYKFQVGDKPTRPNKDDISIRKELETNNYPFYVTYYTEYPAYEPAEGGYYVATAEATHSKGFDTKEEANDYAQELADENGLEKVGSYWIKKSKYIGEDEFIYIENNKSYLSKEKGYDGYESLKESAKDVPNWFKSLCQEAKDKFGKDVYSIRDYLAEHSDVDRDTIREWYIDVRNELGLPIVWDYDEWDKTECYKEDKEPIQYFKNRICPECGKELDKYGYCYNPKCNRDTTKLQKDESVIKDWDSTDSLKDDMADKRVGYRLIVFEYVNTSGKDVGTFDNKQEAMDIADNDYPDAKLAVIRKEKSRGRFSTPVTKRENGSWTSLGKK